MNNDIRSRKWLITINNPLDKGYTHEVLRGLLEKTKQCVYWCMSDEVGLETQTPHTHIYIACSSAVRFSVLFKRFEGAHFDYVRGTSSENRAYVFKLGKWANSEKEDTNISDSHEEWGTLPVERQGCRSDIEALYDMIKEGMSNYEILELCPEYMFSIDKIERARQTVLEKLYRTTWRDVNVTYIYGDAGAGKTRYVMEKYGYEHVYRVTDYQHPFDGYKNEKVIVFEEFRSSFTLSRMLFYLDGYPVELPCRYSNKVACFTEVYIITNIPLRSQYVSEQKYEYETWEAFLRRIHEVMIFKPDDIYKLSCEEYMNGFVPVTRKTPFDRKYKQEKLDL